MQAKDCEVCEYYLYYKIFKTFVMDDLTKIQKHIAELKYQENLTYRQIGTVVNRANSTVHYHITKINDALNGLNKLMELSKLIEGSN